MCSNGVTQVFQSCVKSAQQCPKRISTVLQQYFKCAFKVFPNCPQQCHIVSLTCSKRASTNVPKSASEVLSLCSHHVSHMCHSVLISIPSRSPTISQKGLTSVPNVYHKHPNCCGAYVKCVSHASQTYSQRAPNSVLQMLQTRFKNLLFLFQACSNNVSVSNVCQWCFSNF